MKKKKESLHGRLALLHFPARFGIVTLNSVLVIGRDQATPRSCWPRSSRGSPITGLLAKSTTLTLACPL